MRAFILTVVWCGVLTGWAFAEDSAIAEAVSPAEGVGTAGQKPVATTSEKPTSIFNEEIRRFRFELEDTLVTNDVAKFFMHYYSRSENPGIIGAYPDTETNALVVVGPPDAEAAIRKSLATWLLETADFANVSLEVKKRQLLDERKTCLIEMADIEVAMVEVTQRKDEQAAEELIVLQERLNGFEHELQITERQIEVVKKYLKRLNEVKE